MTQAILGGLIGSILTVSISRIFDIIQKKNEHYYSLKKSFFERKLCVAEAAISQRYIIASCLMTLSVLFEEISKNMALIVNPPPDFLKPLAVSISQQMERLASPAFDAANAVALFFDLEELQDTSFAKEMMNLMMSINGRNMAFQFLVAQYAITQNGAEKEQIFAAGKKIIVEMQADIEKLSAKIEKGFQQVSKIIEKIRLEMKKYES